MEKLKQYRQNIIKSFLINFLEIDITTAEKDALKLSSSVSETTAIKLVHFMDCILQCSTSNTKKCSNNTSCESCCGNCNCKN